MTLIEALATQREFKRKDAWGWNKPGHVTNSSSFTVEEILATDWVVKSVDYDKREAEVREQISKLWKSLQESEE